MISEPAPEKILVLLPNWLGDAVMATPALRALRRHFPEARITAAGKPGICTLLRHFPHVDALAQVPAKAGLSTLFCAGRTLEPESRDLCIILPHSFRAALLARFTGARIRMGFDRGGRRPLLSHPIPWRQRTPVYTAREYLALVQAVGAAPDEEGLELGLAPDVLETMRARLAGPGPLVALAPGAAFGPSKCWPAERYAAVADALHREHGARCVLLTGPGEEAVRAAVLDAVRTPVLDPYAGPPDMEQLKAAIASADVLLSNDSGPRHVAIAFKKPVICIMGPTSPLYTQSPWERGEVLRVNVDCGPCQRPVCRTDHRCMTRIGVEQVVRAVSRQLAHDARKASAAAAP